MTDQSLTFAQDNLQKMAATARLARALVVQQLVATGDADSVEYWLDEYVSQHSAMLREASMTAAGRAEHAIAGLERENALLRLSLAVARTGLDKQALHGQR